MIRYVTFIGLAFVVYLISMVSLYRNNIRLKSLLELGKYYYEFAQNLPKLTTVAHTMLAVPATSTSSERAFSLAGRILEERRTQLSPDTVDSLLFLHTGCAHDDKW